MSVKTIKQFAKSSFYFSTLAIMVFQFFGVAFVASQKVSAQGSAAPDGPVKTFIIKYGSLPGEPSESKGAEEDRAKYNWQKNKVMADLTDTEGYKKIVRNLSEMPISIMQADKKGEESLRANKRIVSVTEDVKLKNDMENVIPLLGGTVANGYSDGTTNFIGTDKVVAVIDSGFNLNRAELGGAKVVSEACYSLASEVYVDAEIISGCPGGAASSTATGSSQSTSTAGSITDPGENEHGTMTSTTAAGAQVTDGSTTYSGIAKGAKLILIKTLVGFQEVSGGPDLCDDAPQTSKCWSLYGSGLLSGLNRVLQIHNEGLVGDPIASVNNSWSTSYYASDLAECNADATTDGVDIYINVVNSLRAANIAPVFSAGNGGQTNINKIKQPCISGIIKVGATSKASDTMTYYSNGGSRTDIVAPGGNIGGPNDDGGIMLPTENTTGLDGVQGTSFSTPVVAGAWAVMREKNPTATVDTVLRLMQESGVTVAEDRASWTAVDYKRLSLDDALAASTNKPSITSLTPVGSGFADGDTVNIDIVAPNATTCTLGSETVNLTGGAGGITVTATSGSQTYNIVCSDAQGYSATLGVTFSATGTGDFGGGGGPGDGTVLINGPGTPNTGFGLFLNNPITIIVSTTLAALGIILIARKTKFTTKSSRR